MHTPRLTEADLNFLYQATEEGPSLHHVTNYWSNLADYVEARVGVELKSLRQRLKQMSQVLPLAREVAITRAAEARPEEKDVLQQVQELIDEIDQATREEVVPERPDTAEYHLAMGNLRFNAGDYPGAIEAFTRAIELEPDCAMAYFNRGLAYSLKGDYDHAIADYDRAIELDPDNVTAYSNRGLVYTYRGDYASALRDYERAMDLDPEYRYAYYNKACLYSISGDTDQALSWLRQAFEKDRADGSSECVTHARTDRDFDPIRDNPRFQALLAEFAPDGEA